MASPASQHVQPAKNGVVREVADGTHIPNLGERKLLGVMADGNAKEVTAHVCAVNNMLMSVSKVTSKRG